MKILIWGILQMNNKFQLKVKEIVERPTFHKAKVVAGEKGLDNVVQWVHILEVTEISRLLNGHEFILTTGIGWKENKELCLTLLQQLIDKKASGLCVELGTYIHELPGEMIELAQKHDFPIIVFHEEVRFIDITQELNALLMEGHNQMMIKLEAVSNQFNQLVLATDGFHRILRLLYQSLNVQVVYKPKEGEPKFYPPIDRLKEEEILEQIRQAKPQSVVNTFAKSASKPVQALGHKFADIIILSNGNYLTELDYLVLDRAATALSQDQMRLLYVKEKNKHEKNNWVYEWLNNEHSKGSIEQYLLGLDRTLTINGCVACICEANVDDEEVDLTFYSIVFCDLFERFGFYPLVYYDRNKLLFALVNKRSSSDWKERLVEAIKKIKETDFIKNKMADHLLFGVGKLYEIDQLHVSYKEARETLYVRRKLNLPTIFYVDLYIYRFMLKLNKQKYLQGFMEDYLHPVLHFEKDSGGEMYETLKVLLEVNGSRKEAAERLHIVRQTLYHRIDKLKELLGDDFMEGEKRLAIELAVYAKEFIK